MRLFILMAALVSLTVLSSCIDFNKIKNKIEENNTTETAAITIRDEYRMDIPVYMKETTGLNDDASLQFKNIFKETYVVVIDEDKETFIQTFMDMGEYDTTLSVVENYQAIQLGYLSENLEITSQVNLEIKEINQRNARMTEIDGKLDDISISYLMTYVEGDQNVYMIMAWTLADRKIKYQNAFMAMSKSFTLL